MTTKEIEMVTEEQKFRAETIRLGGVAFMTPLGKAILELFDLINKYGPLMFFIFFIYSLGLAYIGLVFIVRSYDIITFSKRGQK